MVAAQALETAGMERRVRLLLERAVEKEARGGQPESNICPPYWSGLSAVDRVEVASDSKGLAAGARGLLRIGRQTWP